MTSGKHRTPKNKIGPAPKKQSLWQEIRKRYFFYLLPIPGIISLILFSYIPMAGIYIAFENYTYQGGLFGSEFVGLKNFQFFFANMGNALRATRNTLVINIGSIVLGTALNVTVAVIMGEINRERYRKAMQTVILFPHFLSWIVVGALSEVLLDTKNGLLNQLIVSLGGEAIEWSYAPQYWWAILIITSLWKGFGYGSVVYYATLTGFDPTLYEAAEVDGASRWKKIRSITLPLLKPTIVTLFLLNIGGILGGSLEQIMGMTKMAPALFETTDTITTFVYRSTISSTNFSMSSAIGLYQSVFGFLLVLSSNLLAKKIDPDYGLF
ncbi:MAG: sugar ABC transporter permease [Lachnospiraceae bacterium]|jgi:putative aldouronate transport system permease protein|nr:sugar ABC transporter permease [Lachnospiraceae bacterium]